MGRKRQKKHNDCRAKARFGTQEEALEAQPAQVAYLCSKCLCFHLTTSVPF